LIKHIHSTYLSFWFYEKFIMMWHSVKFQFALLFAILRTSTQLGVVQLKDGATDSQVENITNQSINCMFIPSTIFDFSRNKGFK